MASVVGFDHFNASLLNKNINFFFFKNECLHLCKFIGNISISMQVKPVIKVTKAVVLFCCHCFGCTTALK